MDMINQETIDAIRTAGQLLLHRPATGSFAYREDGTICGSRDPRACCFCYLGAISAVCDKLKRADETEVHKICWRLTRIDCGSKWDNASMTERDAIAQKLAEYQG